MTIQREQKQLWIGLIEARAVHGKNRILGDTKGAFVNIVTWASNVREYEQNVRLLIGDLGGMYVFQITDAEPVEDKRQKKKDGFEEEIEDMISRAKGNPNAIIYGTFHTYEKDDA